MRYFVSSTLRLYRDVVNGFKASMDNLKGLSVKADKTAYGQLLEKSIEIIGGNNVEVPRSELLKCMLDMVWESDCSKFKLEGKVSLVEPPLVFSEL